MLASASDDKTIKLWELDGTLIRTLENHLDWVWDLSFSPDSQMLASASADQTIKLWRLDGTLINSFQGHKSGIRSMSFSPDGNMLASASADKTVKIWRLDGTFTTDNTLILWKSNLNFDLNYLLDRGKKWVHDYLANNPNS